MAKKKTPPAASPWRNRIVGHDEVLASDLMANPRNWRKHPKEQEAALSGILSEVGWAQNVIVNRTTGHILDGHLRVSIAVKRGEKVPVVYIEVSEEDELKLLATIDPLAAMASTDKDLLRELLHDVTSNDAAVMELLDGLATKAGVVPGAEGGDAETTEVPVIWGVIIECESEQEQVALLEEFTGRSLKCRALL